MNIPKDMMMLIAILIATIVLGLLNQPTFAVAPVGRLCQRPR
jgi:hypothetical protein